MHVAIDYRWMAYLPSIQELAIECQQMFQTMNFFSDPIRLSREREIL